MQFNIKNRKKININLDKDKSKNVLEIKNLNFKYPGAKRGTLQLDNINIKIEKGKWTSILGPNGSGKSTLAKAIVRINKVKPGNVLLYGEHIHDFKAKEFAKHVAYIPQQIDIPHGTSVYDFISFGRNPYLGITSKLSQVDKKIIKYSMKQSGTWEWKDKMMDELSGGQRQKVLIAMIIVQDADVIILDEPTTYLDIRNQYELLEMMHHQHLHGKTIITILHDINQAVQYSDMIYIMKEGAIFVEGTPDKAINSKILEDVYGVKTSLYQDGARKYITDVKLVDFELGDIDQIGDLDHRKKRTVTVNKNHGNKSRRSQNTK